MTEKQKEKLDQARATLYRAAWQEIEDIAGGNPGNVVQLKTALEGIKLLDEFENMS